MNSAKTFVILAFVFLMAGTVFLIVGLTTNLTPFKVIGPACAVLGLVFLIYLKVRNAQESSTPPA